MEKFKRNYSLEVQIDDSGIPLLIEPPFTIEFDIKRDNLSDLNVGNVRIYNLSRDNRNKIRKDQYVGGAEKRIILKAGYGDNLSVILDGNIFQAWSVREGTDFVTEIQSFDFGAFASLNAKTNKSYPGGTAFRSIILDLVDSLGLYGIKTGAIDAYPGSLPDGRGNTYSGDTYKILNDLTGGQCFFDNGVIHCLADRSVIEGDLVTVNSASGLLGTPVRELQYLSLEMLFEPKIFVNQEILLDSVTFDDLRPGTSSSPNFNGICQVIGLQHKGMISESVCGNATTNLKLIAGEFNKVRAGDTI